MKYIRFDIVKHREILKILSQFLGHNDIKLRNDQLTFLFSNKYTVEDILENWQLYSAKFKDLETENDQLSIDNQKLTRDILDAEGLSFYENLKNKYDFIKTLSIEDILLYNTEELTRIITSYFQCLNKISTSRYKNFSKKHYYLFFGIFLKDVVGTNKIARLRDYNYIKRKLDTISKQQNELNKIKSGKVGIKESYVSDTALKSQKEKEEKTLKYLDREFYNPKNGFKINLKDIIKSDKDKVAELLTISKGVENIAEIEGYTWRFITITCPSEYHRVTTSHNGNKVLNEKYKGISPKDANKFLQKSWERIRALLSKRGIDFFGLYCTEPHVDGTPHRHLLIYAPADCFASKESLDLLSKKQQKKAYAKNVKDFNNYVSNFIESQSHTIESCFLQHFNFSLKALKIEYPHSVKNDKGEDVQATPTTYILKYVMKSLGVSEYEDNEAENADKVKATSSIFKYRRYGLFGLKQVLSTYRTMLKIQELPENIECKHFVNAFNFLKMKEKDKDGNDKIRTDFCNFYLNIINSEVIKHKENRINSYGEEVQDIIGLKHKELIIYEKDKFYDLHELMIEDNIYFEDSDITILD